MNFLNRHRIIFVMILTILLSTGIFAETRFQMEWGNHSIDGETWGQVNLSTNFTNPVVIATPVYTTTTAAAGNMIMVTNITNTTFLAKATNYLFTNTDRVGFHYIVMEEGNWTLPNTSIKVEAGTFTTTKNPGYTGGNWGCPTYGETVTFTNAFDSNPLVLSARASNVNNSQWFHTISSAQSSVAEVPTTGMCIGFARSRIASTVTINSAERLDWIAADEGNFTIAGAESEILWQLDDAAVPSGGSWINGYGDTPPFSQNWAHTWTGSPNVIAVGQTSIRGGDGSFPVLYDTGNTASIRMFVDESNERSHAGSESGGGWAFNHSAYVWEPEEVNWTSATLDLGIGNVDQGNLTGSQAFETYKPNDNVQVVCDEGDCNNISTTWTTINAAHASANSPAFTCDDGHAGTYWAMFNLSSTQDQTHAQLNVSCEINQTYGALSLVLNTPTVGSDLIVIQNDTVWVNSTLTCNGVVGAVCGNMSLFVRHNVTGGVFENITTVSTGLPLWTAYPNPVYCDLNRGESCSINWSINATGANNTLHILNVNTTSDLSQVAANTTGNFTINITVPSPGTILWSATSLNLGTGGLNLGDISDSAQLIPTGNHSNVTVTCVNGACLNITDDWTDDINVSDGNNTPVTFTCDDGHVGNYWAEFRVNSTQDITGSVINASCEITQTYGTLAVSLLEPSINPLQIGRYTQFNVTGRVSCEGTIGAICGNVSGNSRHNDVPTEYGNGRDGSRTITVNNTIINNYTHVTGNESSGNITITVADASEFAQGDEIMIIQSQNTSEGRAGEYEFATIASISVNDITLDQAINKSFYSGNFDSTAATVTQIVKVLNYDTLTIDSSGSITAKAWDGFSGGIVAFRALGEVDTDGYINVSHLGFRGGDCNGCSDGAWGDQGEGYQGTGTGAVTANANGGGGGYGPTGFGGEAGAGGGHATAGGGGTASNPSTGGGIVGFVNLSTMLFGGGAGAGGDNDDFTPSPENIDGGGIVFVATPSMPNARVLATGEHGFHSDSFGGTSGGGAGGTIWLIGESISITDVNASGAQSEASTSDSDVGGAGGDGRVRIDANMSTGASIPNAKYNGTFSGLGGEMIIINTTPTASPFVALHPQPQYCGIMIRGDSCDLTWTVNATGVGEYNIDANFSSNLSQVAMNSTDKTLVEITTDIVATIISPLNRSYIFDTQILWANITTSQVVANAYYILDSNLSNRTLMSNTTGMAWHSEIGNISFGLHNITFVFNNSDNTENFTSNTHYFKYLSNDHKTANKYINTFGTDLYLVKNTITNNLSKSQDLILTEFADDDMNAGSFTPMRDFFNLTSGPDYFGVIHVWNFTMTPSSANEINYSLTNTIGDYEMLPNFVLGFQ